MKYTPRELAARISAGGRAGAAHTARIRRDKRARYQAGTMSDDEKSSYEHYLEQRREAGRRGGSTTAARRMDKSMGLPPGTTIVAFSNPMSFPNNSKPVFVDGQSESEDYGNIVVTAYSENQNG